ncbi:MAG: flippase [Patescibacteria group bacterium]
MSNVADIHHPAKVARSGAIYTGALIIQKIISFSYFSLVASALGPANLGRYTFALSFAAFFSLVVDFGFVNMAIRNFSREKEGRERNFRILLTARLGLAVLGAIVLWATALALGYDNTLLALLAVTTVIMVMDAFTAFFYTVFRAEQNLFYESIGTLVFQIVIFIAGYLALRQTNDLRVLLAIISLGSFWHVVYSALLLKFRARLSLKPLFDWPAIKGTLAAAVPFFLMAGFIKAYNTIDTILLKNISGDEAAGLYAIPAKVVFTFPFLALGITAAVYPAMASYASASPERLQNIFRRTLQLLLTISLPICLGIFILAEPIITRVWPEFQAAIPALRILIWAVVFLFIEYPFGSLLNATGNEKKNTWNRGLQLAVFVIMNIVLIPQYGFMGAVYTALATSILIVFLGAYRARRLAVIFTKSFVAVLVKLLVAAAVMGGVVAWIAGHYPFLYAIPAGALVYALMFLILQVYKKEDWEWLKSLKK